MSAAGSSAHSLEIIDARSPANRYLVQLLEDKRELSFRPLTPERLLLVFRILDEVTPQLGTFSRLIGLIRAELYEAVYAQPGGGASSLPCFTLLQRMREERNEEAEDLKAELQRIKALLSQEEETTRTLRCSITALQEENQSLHSTIATLKAELATSRTRSQMLAAEVQTLDRQLEVESQRHAVLLLSMEEQLQDSTNKVGEMEEQLACYAALRAAFQSPLIRRKQNVLSDPGRVLAGRSSASPAFVTSYLQASHHLYLQLLHVRDNVMDDYDAFLESRSNQSEMDKTEMPPEGEVFLARLSDLSLELEILSQQIEALEERRTNHSQVSRRLDSAHRFLLLPSDSESLKEGSAGRMLSAATHPEEALLSRYAAIIYTSQDQGRIFQELPGATPCQSCGQKTLLCPHKVAASQLIRLPEKCTHLKICRPRAQHSAGQGAGSIGTAATIIQNSVDRSQSGAASWFVVEKLSQLEEAEPEKRLNMKRESSRLLSQELCVSLTQQMGAAILRQLEGRSPPCPLQEVVHGVFQRRYVNKEVSARAMEDYSRALRRYAPDSLVMRLLDSVLCHRLSPAILSYAVLLAQTLQATPLSNISECQSFLHERYHFLEEVEQETLLLEFTAYSKSRSSTATMMAFLLHLLLQQREPLLREREEELSSHKSGRDQAHHMTQEELTAALDAICPITDQREMKSFFQRLVTLNSSNLIPLQEAAYIAAYQLERSKRSLSLEETHPQNTGRKADLCDLELLLNIVRLARNC